LDFFLKNNENNFYYQPILSIWLIKNYLTTSNMMEQAVLCEKKPCTLFKIRVGAALLLDNGQTVLGSNQENAAYPSGLCAERVAFQIFILSKILKYAASTPIKQ
jgi:cytidine deaminase